MQLITILLIFWMQLSERHGQQVKQTPQFQYIKEGENFTTYCNFSGILNNLQWYKQKPGGCPVFLMILTKGAEVKKQERLTAQFGGKRKDSSLHITATQTTDVGTYFCAV
ncbi:T-cell receptor alpha chain V region CTL-L17, partial [Heterocephalus glaber]